MEITGSIYSLDSHPYEYKTEKGFIGKSRFWKSRWLWYYWLLEAKPILDVKCLAGSWKNSIGKSNFDPKLLKRRRVRGTFGFGWSLAELKVLTVAELSPQRFSKRFPLTLVLLFYVLCRMMMTLRVEICREDSLGTKERFRKKCAEQSPQMSN